MFPALVLRGWSSHRPRALSSLARPRPSRALSGQGRPCGRGGPGGRVGSHTCPPTSSPRPTLSASNALGLMPLRAARSAQPCSGARVRFPTPARSPLCRSATPTVRLVPHLLRGTRNSPAARRCDRFWPARCPHRWCQVDTQWTTSCDPEAGAEEVRGSRARPDEQDKFAWLDDSVAIGCDHGAGGGGKPQLDGHALARLDSDLLV